MCCCFYKTHITALSLKVIELGFNGQVIPKQEAEG